MSTVTIGDAWAEPSPMVGVGTFRAARMDPGLDRHTDPSQRDWDAPAMAPRLISPHLAVG